MAIIFLRKKKGSHHLSIMLLDSMKIYNDFPQNFIECGGKGANIKY